MPMLTWVGKDKVVNHHHDVPFRILSQQMPRLYQKVSMVRKHQWGFLNHGSLTILPILKIFSGGTETFPEAKDSGSMVLSIITQILLLGQKPARLLLSKPREMIGIILTRNSSLSSESFGKRNEVLSLNT